MLKISTIKGCLIEIEYCQFCLSLIYNGRVDAQSMRMILREDLRDFPLKWWIIFRSQLGL